MLGLGVVAGRERRHWGGGLDTQWVTKRAV
jgi:hypothetical protein